MKIVKKIILWLLLLIVMVICGTVTLKIFDLFLKLGYENICISGSKVGFIAWLSIIIINEYSRFVKSKEK